MKFITGIISLLIALNLTAQEKYPQLRSPLDIPLILSGTFGELRSNHFHSGIDIKTQGVEGQRVYAVADGYVSRINVSPYGYGNAIYITHPNGYTSVYAHLQRFNDSIAAIIKWVQYKRKKFAIEYYPDKTSIPVKKGQLIAFTGNSGSSGGPHLHFEIRKTANAHPVNPLFFGINVADHQYPRISSLAVYDFFSPLYQERKIYSLKQSGGKVRLTRNDTLLVNKDFYVGVESIDKLDGAANKNGIYRLEFSLDDSLLFIFQAKELSFSEKRYINSYIDYEAYKTESVRYQRSWIQANNHLSNTKAFGNHGIFSLKDDRPHKISIVSSDFAGQKSKLVFYVKRNPAKRDFISSKEQVFHWDHNNIYRTKDLIFNIPKGTLFDDMIFEVKRDSNPYNTYSPVFTIGNKNIPLFSYCKVSIKADTSLNDNLKSKACIVSLGKKGSFYYEGGQYKDGFVSTKTRSFGTYLISVDTIAPKIKNYNVYPNKDITHQATIAFTVTDNLSGLKSYNAFIDGKWVLLEYDPKRKRMYYRIDQRFPQGKHHWKIVIRDGKGNTSTVEMDLRRR